MRRSEVWRMLQMTPLKLKLKRRFNDLQSQLARHQLVLVNLMFVEPASDADVIDLRASLIPKRNSSLDNGIKERANSRALRDWDREELYNQNISVVPTVNLGHYTVTAQLNPSGSMGSLYTEGEIQIRPRYIGEIGFTLRNYVKQLPRPLIKELGGFLILLRKLANLQRRSLLTELS